MLTFFPGKGGKESRFTHQIINPKVITEGFSYKTMPQSYFS